VVLINCPSGPGPDRDTKKKYLLGKRFCSEESTIISFDLEIFWAKINNFVVPKNSKIFQFEGATRENQLNIYKLKKYILELLCGFSGSFELWKSKKMFVVCGNT
jgi:hypothetical protein